MMRNCAAFLLLIILSATHVPLAMAQEVDAPVEVAEESQPDPLARTEEVIAEEDTFERIAQRAEELAASDGVSMFAISRLRAELVEWRDKFLAETNINAGRIATVDAQIAALGPVPESGEEAPAVAKRREELIAQRQSLTAPRLLAEEAHARANGIISEFDAIVLRRETAALTVRGPSPLNPAHFAAAVAGVVGLVQVIGVELAARFNVQSGAGTLLTSLPRGLLFLIAGVGLLGIGRRRVTKWYGQFSQGDGRWRPAVLFALSLVQIIVPVAGLFLLTEGIETLNLLGLRSADMVANIPFAGFLVVFAWWMARHVFPDGEDRGYLGYDAHTRASGRRYTSAMGWVLALGSMLDAGLRTMEMSEGALAAVEWPVLLIIGVLFWRLGRVIKTPPEETGAEGISNGRMRGWVGQFCTIVSILGPLLSAFGFGAAGRAVLIPSIMSVALIGVLILLQRIVHELSVRRSDEDENRGLLALLPVFVSFAFYLASLPLFALIWGARVDDLLEVWARFREGFSVGATRISPTDFLTFVAVFAFGYLLTRFIQSTLRKSVMPRTRLDIGGQNAIVAGFGYVGIILAAIIAITSAGLDLSNLAIVAGALSVGIGFGLQNIVSNFISGVILLIERPISEGDWIEVGGQMGYVRAISVRSTRIETFDRTDVIVPNADLVSNQVTNWTRGNLVGRVIVPVGVAYGSDVDHVTKILQGIAEKHPLVVGTPPPAVLFIGFGADSLDFEIRAILRDVNYVMVAKSEMNHEIAKQFAEAGIEIPFAQRDIWLRNPEVLKENSE